MKEYGEYYQPTEEEKRKKLFFARPPEPPAQEPAPEPADHEEPTPATEKNSKALVLLYELPTAQVTDPNRGGHHDEPPTRSKPIELFTASMERSHPPDYNSPTYWQETNVTSIGIGIEEGKITNPDVLPIYYQKAWKVTKEWYKGRADEAEEMKLIEYALPALNGDPQTIRKLTKQEAHDVINHHDILAPTEAAKNWIHIGKAYAAKHQPQQEAA